MKNQKERATFLANDCNWTTTFEDALIRVQKISYKGEDRFRVQVYQWNSTFFYDTRKQGHKAEYTTKGFYKLNEIYHALEVQSLTEMRAWLDDLDRRYPDKASQGALPKTLDMQKGGKRHG